MQELRTEGCARVLHASSSFIPQGNGHVETDLIARSWSRSGPRRSFDATAGALPGATSLPKRAAKHWGSGSPSGGGDTRSPDIGGGRRDRSIYPPTPVGLIKGVKITPCTDYKNH